ncbi:MAG: hypothetical protein LIP23_03040 [Planctomycetes bacterium]|nr:hypothetical protein [Planctomycetota bacterium]
MADMWRIGRRTRHCAASGESIEPGTVFYSGLIENGDDFERKDYSPEAWPEIDKAQFYSYWKNKPAAQGGESKKVQVDYDRLLAFYDSLDGAEEPGRRLFRYVLALIFVRKRILRLDDMARSLDGDKLILHDRRDGGRTVEITAPDATAEQLAAVQQKLNQLFDYEDGELEG